jgi:hypothetical protein
MDSVDRAKKKEWKEVERHRARRAFPLPDSELEKLFAALDADLKAQGCDETRRFTEAWAQMHSHPLESLRAWLYDTGGFCDCEVLANSASHWNENRVRPADA